MAQNGLMHQPGVAVQPDARVTPAPHGAMLASPSEKRGAAGPRLPHEAGWPRLRSRGAEAERRRRHSRAVPPRRPGACSRGRGGLWAPPRARRRPHPPSRPPGVRGWLPRRRLRSGRAPRPAASPRPYQRPPRRPRPAGAASRERAGRPPPVPGGCALRPGGAARPRPGLRRPRRRACSASCARHPGAGVPPPAHTCRAHGAPKTRFLCVAPPAPALGARGDFKARRRRARSRSWPAELDFPALCCVLYF